MPRGIYKREKPKTGHSRTLHIVANQLEKAIHAYVVKGGKMGRVEILAMLLAQEILKSEE